MNKLLEKVCDLISVKSIVTILLTVGMLFLLSGSWAPPEAIVALFSSAYGSIMTYFFTKKDKGDNNAVDKH